MSKNDKVHNSFIKPILHLYRDCNEIDDEVSKNDKVHNSFIKPILHLYGDCKRNYPNQIFHPIDLINVSKILLKSGILIYF